MDQNTDAIVFPKGSYALTQFHLYDTPIDRAEEITLLPEGVPRRLGCGFFHMENNGFDLTYPREEVMYIINGRLRLVTERSETVLNAGDVLRVPPGLDARISTDSEVDILFVSNPVEGGKD